MKRKVRVALLRTRQAASVAYFTIWAITHVTIALVCAFASAIVEATQDD